MMTVRGRLLGAHLGLCAFVLIILAPLFSQSRAETRDWSWLEEIACHDTAGQFDSAPPDARQPLSLDACAYCSLLAANPAVGGQGWSRQPVVAAPVGVVSAEPVQPLLAPRFSASRSRAPPALGC